MATRKTDNGEVTVPPGGAAQPATRAGGARKGATTADVQGGTGAGLANVGTTGTGGAAGGAGAAGAAKKGPAKKSAGTGTAGTAGAAGTGAGTGATRGAARPAGAAAKSTGAAAKSTGAAAKSTAKTAAKSAGGARGRSGGGDLRTDLREFASGRPQGWNHEDWLGFLEHLKGRGHNINDQEQIGSMLEKERIHVLLERVPGLSAQKLRSLADRFGSLWRLRETDADSLAREANLPPDVAQRVLDTVRSR